jgi:hypothetical protein
VGLRRGLCELRREKNLCNREESGRRTGSTDPVSGRSAREEEEEAGGREEGRERGRRTLPPHGFQADPQRAQRFAEGSANIMQCR